MKNLLKFEFYKLKKQKSLYICTIIMLVFAYVSLRLSKSMAENPAPGSSTTTQLCGVYAMLQGISISNFVQILGIFIAIFVCADFSEQTIKNIYSRGFSREQVYIAKWIVAVTITTAMYIIVLLFSLALGSAMFSNSAPSGNYALCFIGQYFYIIAIMSFSFCFSIIFKKAGPSVAIAILGITVIGLIFSLIDNLIDTETFKVADYWLSNFSNPLTSLTTSNSRLTVCMVLSIVYAVLFSGIGFFVMRKNDD